MTVTDCRGQRTDLVRDALGQLLAKQTRDGVVRYAYDALGRMVAVAAPHAEQRFIYDALGQLLEERSGYYLSSPRTDCATQAPVPDAAFVITHAYDELGSHTRTTLPNGRQIDLLRYGSGHWHGTLWQGATVVDIERDRLHREKLRRFGSSGAQLTAIREYDPQSRLTAITLKSGGGTSSLPERRFSYDAVGNLLAIRLNCDLDSTLDGARYTYDPLGQLLSAVQPELTEMFAFDPAGNLLDLETDAAKADEPSGPAGRARVLSSVAHNLLRSIGGFRYEYDEQGNVVRKSANASGGTYLRDELALAYDAENRLIRAVRTRSGTRHSAQYFYDAFSRRIAKTVRTEEWRNVKAQDDGDLAICRDDSRIFVWDGDVLAQELLPDKTVTYLYEPDSFMPLARVASEPDLAGRTGEHGSRVQTTDDGGFVHLWPMWEWGFPQKIDEMGRTALVREVTEAERRHEIAWERRRKDAESAALRDRIDYYSCDHLGTPREVIDREGKVVWRAKFKTWGRVFSFDVSVGLGASASELEQPLRFQGQYEDDESGLYYNRYRYYDPDAARFVTQDPIGLFGGIHGYRYAPNPTGWIDPTGLAKNCPKPPKCDPCDGINPAAWARQWQGRKAYPGRDDWKNTVLTKGAVIYGGVPGQTGFYFDHSTLLNSGGSKSALGKSLQIRPHPEFGYRSQVQEYRVKKDICVGTSNALAQDKEKFGDGGGTQYFLSNFKGNLERINSPLSMK